MRSLLIGLLLALSLVGFACSSGPKTPEEQLAAAQDLLSQGYEMSAAERQSIEDRIAQGKSLLEAGKKEEAASVLGKALADLQAIGDRDRLNKAE
ncbi:MAG: hypothetical protein Kow0092_35060 [Deferrisomatales bacterium]